MNRRELLALFGLGTAALVLPVPKLLEPKAPPPPMLPPLEPDEQDEFAYIRGLSAFGTSGTYGNRASTIRVFADDRVVLAFGLNPCGGALRYVAPPNWQVCGRQFSLRIDGSQDAVAHLHLRRGKRDFLITTLNEKEIDLHA